MKPARILLIDDLRLDLAARRVFRDGEEIELGRLTFDLFAALARAAPAALSAHEIVARVWDSNVVTDETLQQRVSLLRRALGQGSSREYVQTVRGFGYRLATEPVPLDEPHSLANQAEPAPSGEDVSQAESKMASPGPTRTPGARLLRAVLIALAILALLLAITVLAIMVRQVKRWTPESFSTSYLLDPAADSSGIARTLTRGRSARIPAGISSERPRQPGQADGGPQEEASRPLLPGCLQRAVEVRDSGVAGGRRPGPSTDSPTGRSAWSPDAARRACARWARDERGGLACRPC